MHYTRISADCHIDMPWIPPDLFTSNASAAMKERMPYVTDGPDGPHWTCRNGGALGLINGGGAAGGKQLPPPPLQAGVPAPAPPPPARAKRHPPAPHPPPPPRGEECAP